MPEKAKGKVSRGERPWKYVREEMRTEDRLPLPASDRALHKPNCIEENT